MIRVLVIGQGMVGTYFALGLERLKSGEMKPYGVPLADLELKYSPRDINLVASIDVDARKVNRSVYQVAREVYGFERIPSTLKHVRIYPGIELGLMRDLNVPIISLDSELPLRGCVDKLCDYYSSFRPDVILDLSTTQYAAPLQELSVLEERIRSNRIEGLVPSQLYAYAALKYAEGGRTVAYVNLIPVPLANSSAFVSAAKEVSSLILGDDAATGATPLTADILEHLKERNKFVRSIVQLNIGGNMDFLSLLDRERNLAKEHTKSSIVSDILGYEAPHYIRPTGYLKPLGDKKVVAIHIEYESFLGVTDEIFVNMRINDSPALAGYLIDLTRLAKLALERGFSGTIYEINAFYMKHPGPPGSPNLSRILAYTRLLQFIERNLIA
ncbi:MAG: myo-inositol-1-phosphate synthase [Thermoprotei archaeon]|nr:MAG: myo-inositol-1-phosphate synthase [Thermoprotei archaeon]